MNRAERLKFELLARRAGNLASGCVAEKAFLVWLDVVKQRVFRDAVQDWIPKHNGYLAPEHIRERFEQYMRNRGIVTNPFEVSADLCLERQIIAEGNPHVPTLPKTSVEVSSAQGGRRALNEPRTASWDSLQSGFMQLRMDCAINPPIATAGRLTAIWQAFPEPGEWLLSYRDREDGTGVRERFKWHAQEGSALLGYVGNLKGALPNWLDQIRDNAPESHLKTTVWRRAEGDEQIYAIEVLDVCGLSADFCRNCNAKELVSFNPPVVSKLVLKRLPGTIESVEGARRMDRYLASKALGLTEFATKARTTDRTLRKFRTKGRVRRDIFANIAEAMGLTKEDLLKPE